jgi:UDP-N-acetylmuramoyl-tripeptide--D-alanyl-D-alanine ligase
MITIEKLYELFIKNPVVCTDSRNIVQGSFFFALKGPAFNGNEFAEAALAQGASYSIIDEHSFQKSGNYFLVEDVLSTLQQLANHHRRKLNIPILAITGSNGKTTTKELVRNVLAKKYKTIATKGNLNNHIGVPLTILSIPLDAEFAVIEMGANHQHEIESYCKVAEPSYGLITNIGKAHLEGFGGFEGVKKGKGELYNWLSKNDGCAFINWNNNHLLNMAGENALVKIIKYGTNDNLFCSGKLINEQPSLLVEWKSESRFGEIKSQLTGSYNFENILAAVCIGNYFKVKPEDIDAAINEYVPDNSRSQIIKKGTNTIILDAYNAKPTSMEAALNNFNKISAANKIVFIGDMAELGSESDEEHKHILSLLSENKYSKIILVGKNFGRFFSPGKGFHFDDSEKAAAWLKQHLPENTFILIKGSRSTKMEKILDALS